MTLLMSNVQLNGQNIHVLNINGIKIINKKPESDYVFLNLKK